MGAASEYGKRTSLLCIAAATVSNTAPIDACPFEKIVISIPQMVYFDESLKDAFSNDGGFSSDLMLKFPVDSWCWEFPTWCGLAGQGFRNQLPISWMGTLFTMPDSQHRIPIKN